jgi:LmbE family N-acetylglucosaminyl deacetylase
VRRILAIGAHPDDCEIGAGATLAKHAAAGDDVVVLVMGRGRPNQFSIFPQPLAALGVARYSASSFPDQKYDTVPLTDLVAVVEMTARRGRFDVVYTHHEGDLNLDHAITARAVKTAFRPKPGIKAPRILAFEVLSSTELGAPFIPNVFVDVDGEPMEKKLKALEAYGDEIPPAPHPRSLEAVKHLAGLRGASVGLRQVEAFVLLREVI